jgi:hypothetical protein
LEENSSKINNVIVGIYDGNLSKTGKYQALIGLDLLEDRDVNERLKVSM